MGLAVNILTSGFLVTVIIFFVLMTYLFYVSAAKMGDVLLVGDHRSNNLEQVESAFNAAKVAYVASAVGAVLTLALAILYAGHEIVVTPSEYWHLALYVLTYIALIVSVIYAFIALDRLYNLQVTDRNGAESYLWAGLLMSLFAFIGLTATGSGRIGMNVVRRNTRERIERVEATIHSHLPEIKDKLVQAEAVLTQHLPDAKNKLDELHATVVSGAPVPQVIQPVSVPVGQPIAVQPMYVSNGVPRQVLSSGPSMNSSLQCGVPSPTNGRMGV